VFASIIYQVWDIGIQTEARMSVWTDAGFQHLRQSHLNLDEGHQKHLKAQHLQIPRKNVSVTVTRRHRTASVV
jgi:hypothetical protein